jgi:Xaa-Pro aminopeptidase
MKLTSGASVQYVDWLAGHLKSGQTLAVDGAVLGLAIARLLQQALEPKDVILRTDVDLLNDVLVNRPDLPTAPVYEHLPPYASKSRSGKLADLRAAMQQHGANRHLMSTLDDIAYLFNLRGADVSYNPVFVAHALVESPTRATLFVADGKISPELRATPGGGRRARRALRPGRRRPGRAAADASLLIDPRRITAGMRAAVPAKVRVVEAINPTTFAKSRKSEPDADHVRATMEQDGAALCEFFAWLEPRWPTRSANR